MSFTPGPFEIAMVAHEVSADLVARETHESAWPDPDEAPATVTPIAVMQPTAATFLREGEVRSRGGLAHAERELLQPDRPTAMISLVCRPKGKSRRFLVERRLAGGTTVNFPPMEVELDDDRCVQVRDLVPAETMGAGEFTYTVEVFDDQTAVASGQRSFHVADAATEAAAASATGG